MGLWLGFEGSGDDLVVVYLGFLEALQVHTRVASHLVELGHLVAGSLQVLPGIHTPQNNQATGFKSIIMVATPTFSRLRSIR